MGGAEQLRLEAGLEYWVSVRVGTRTVQSAESSVSLACDSIQLRSSSSSKPKDSAALNNCCVQRASRSFESAILYIKSQTEAGCQECVAICGY